MVGEDECSLFYGDQILWEIAARLCSVIETDLSAVKFLSFRVFVDSPHFFFSDRSTLFVRQAHEGHV